MASARNDFRARHLRPPPTPAYLRIECAVLFGIIPAILLLLQLRGGLPFLPVLLGMLALTLVLAFFDPRISFRHPGSSARARTALTRILLRVLAAALLLTLLTALLQPDRLFILPRERPALWLLILLFYPIVSVLPQHFLFRTFFHQRYEPLFGDGRTLRLVNALFFAWAHIFFLNPVAPLLTFLAGLLFADTWQRTRSLRAVCLEHALYGQLVFTTGIGCFFYSGSAQTVQHLID